MIRLVLFLVAVASFAASAEARTVDRYVVERDGVRMEITAPRADILRIRAGEHALPADESWAVSADVRARRVPFDMVEDGGKIVLRTSMLTATIDPASLALSVADRQGSVLLTDAPGTPIAFTGGGFTLRKAMPADAHYFGLGDKTGSLDRRGGAFTFWNTDAFGFGPSTDPLYKTVPFLLGMDERGHDFGLFVDNHWRSELDLGKRERAAFSFTAEGGPVDYYVIAGSGPKDVLRGYAYLTGTPPLTPLWALGFQQSHWSYMTQAEAGGIANRLRADRIPADAIWLDIDYQDRNRPFTIDKKAFPDLPKLVRDLTAQKMHLIAITDLHIADAPGQGYAAYDSGIAADAFLRNPDGSHYVGPVWPGPSLFPDFSRHQARDWWGMRFRDLVGMGVAGFWNDMNEPAVFVPPTKTMPLDVVHRIDEPGFATRTATHAEMHNVYGMLNTRATYEGLLKLAPDRRPFVMTRASYAGGQRYAATWTGDNVSSWAHLNLSTTQLVSLGLSGFAYAGDDIGGFAGDAPSADLLTRWIEVGAFNPIFRDHYQKDKPAQEVWVHGPEHEAIRRRYIEERYRLMPYLYALADENSRTGLPIMRPVFLEYPGVLAKGDHLGATETQFMLGDALLIAPPPTGESPAAYKTPLPSAGWYDYWTGRRIEGAEVAEMPRLDRLPVYVRPGTVLPRQPLVQSTAETPRGPLAIDVYPGADCHGGLYLDDGESFAYRRGAFLRQTVGCTSRAIAFGPREGRFRPWWTTIAVTVHGWTGGVPVVKRDGRPVPASIDAATQTLTFELPDMGKPSTVTFD